MVEVGAIKSRLPVFARLFAKPSNGICPEQLWWSWLFWDLHIFYCNVTGIGISNWFQILPKKKWIVYYICVELMTKWVLSKVSVPVQFKWGKFNWKLSNLGLLLPYFELLNLLSWQKQLYFFLSQLWQLWRKGKGILRMHSRSDRLVHAMSIRV